MKMQHQPVQSSHLGKGGSDVGGRGGPQKRVEKKWSEVSREKKKRGSSVEEEESPSIKLGLGDCEEQNHKALLNPGQLFEFQQQALIFKYLKAGLPVPLQLVVPIWKAVASSFGSDTGSFLTQYPSFVGFSRQEFDYKHTMEPEPGRCRRTDGKKWRCSKNVVPDQKYCERHIHRGRQRSRKLVEASQIASLSCKKSATDAESLKTISSHNPCPKSAELTPASDLKNSKAISTLFQFMTPSSNNTTSHDSNTTTTGNINDNKTDVVFLELSNSKGVVGDCVDSSNNVASDANTISSVPSLSSTTSIISTTCTDNKNDVSDSKNSIVTITVAHDTVAATNPITLNNNHTGTRITAMETASIPAATTSSNNNSSIDGKHDSSNCTNTKNMINVNKKGRSSNMSAGFGFSPKSVLQVLGCSGIELEPGRCRRTDGKKWRCSREVVPDQKYCLRHMHRGAKKRVESSQPVGTTTDTVSASRPSAVIISKRTDSATLNTNLSISIPARPLVNNDEEKSPSSSSDATISDSL